MCDNTTLRSAVQRRAHGAATNPSRQQAQRAGEALLGLLARPRSRRGEEIRQLAAAKVVAQHTERGRQVSEPARDLC
jgi:hypothetical protein